jgi:hypothetical protein
MDLLHRPGHIFWSDELAFLDVDHSARLSDF